MRAGERVLDLACGYGRHVAELERLGVRAFGIDLSDFLLRRGLEYGLVGRLVRADLRALPFHAVFDAAASFFLSFGYLADQENARILAGFAAALRPGGRLLIDTWNAARTIAELQPEMVEEREDAIITERSRYNSRTRRVEWTTEVRFRGGDSASWSQSVRAYAPAELDTLLRAAGFTAIRMLGDWDGRPFWEGAPRLVVLADK